jgi:hypothetical protein
MKNLENKTDVKTVEAELDEIGAFLKPFGKPEQENFLEVFRDIDNYLDVILPGRESQDETEFPEFAPIKTFLDSMTDREIVLFALLSALSSADNCSHNEGARYLADLWQEKRKQCVEDVKVLVSDPELGAMATLATTIEIMAS